MTPRVYRITRKGSPFAWIYWRDHEGKQDAECVRAGGAKVRNDAKDAEIKVARAINKKMGQLLAAAPNKDIAAVSMAWTNWVQSWLNVRYAKSSGTLLQYLRRWLPLSQYLRNISVHTPADLTRDQVYGYLEWRPATRRGKHDLEISRNSAINEVKVLRMVLNEAVARGYVVTNVAARLGITPDEAEHARALTDEEIFVIRKELLTAPEFMRVSWEIALHTGLRRNETRLDLAKHISLPLRRITLTKPKGGKKKAFSRPVPEELVPLLEPLIEAKRPWTWEPPEGEGVKPISLQWRAFFDSLGLADVKFHCTRATYITRLHEAGVPIEVAMRLVNHGQADVHRIYAQLSMTYVGGHANAVRYGPPPTLPALPAPQLPSVASGSATSSTPRSPSP